MSKNEFSEEEVNHHDTPSFPEGHPKDHYEEESEFDEQTGEFVLEHHHEEDEYNFFELFIKSLQSNGPGEMVSSWSNLTFLGTISFVSAFMILSYICFATNSFDFLFQKTQVFIHPFLNEWKMSLSTPIFKFLGVISFMALVGSSLSYLSISEKMMDQFLGQPHQSDLMYKAPNYWVILTTVPFLFMGSMLLSLNMELFRFSGNTFFIKTLLFLMAWSCSFLAYSSYYKIISKGSINWNEALIGGFGASIFFEISKVAFLKFSLWSFSYDMVVAIISTGFALTAWQFFLTTVTSMGANLSYVVQNKDVLASENYEDESSEYEFRATREIALIALVESTKKYLTNLDEPGYGDVGIEPAELAKLSFTTVDRANMVLGHLKQVGLVKIFNDGDRRVAVLTVAPDKLRLKKLIDRIEMRHLGVTPSILQHSYSKWFWDHYSQALESKFEGLTLRDLVDLSQDDIYEKNKAA